MNEVPKKNDVIRVPEAEESLRFAIDGIGGSGKSHVGSLMRDVLMNDGLTVIAPKIAGLGMSSRVQHLREIGEYREKSLRDGSASDKVKIDKQQDRIFRLATKHQVRLFERSSQDTYSIAIIDRTPLMTWVYSSALNPENPYLPDILEEGMNMFQRLKLNKVFLLDVPVETAYARIIARYCIGSDNIRERIDEACHAIGSHVESTSMITQMVFDLIENVPNLQPKPFEDWDLIPLEVARRERVLHEEVLELAQKRFGVPFTIIDAQQSIEHVVGQIKKEIHAHTERNT